MNPHCCCLTSSQIRFFWLGIESYSLQDKVLWVQHTWEESRILIWRLAKDFEGEWMWNFEHEDNMHYALQ